MNGRKKIQKLNTDPDVTFVYESIDLSQYSQHITKQEQKDTLSENSFVFDSDVTNISFQRPNSSLYQDVIEVSASPEVPIEEQNVNKSSDSFDSDDTTILSQTPNVALCHDVINVPDTQELPVEEEPDRNLMELKVFLLQIPIKKSTVRFSVDTDVAMFQRQERRWRKKFIVNCSGKKMYRKCSKNGSEDDWISCSSGNRQHCFLCEKKVNNLQEHLKIHKANFYHKYK